MEVTMLISNNYSYHPDGIDTFNITNTMFRYQGRQPIPSDKSSGHMEQTVRYIVWTLRWNVHTLDREFKQPSDQYLGY